MVTLNLKLYAAPLALLMLSATFAAPKANAEPQTAARTFEVKFRYNPAETAAEIYADLKQTAEHACRAPGQRPVSLRRYDEQCTARLMDKVLQRIGRKDLAAVHAKVQLG